MDSIFVDQALYEGRPEGIGRAPREMEVYDLLDRLHIPYFRADHGPAATVESCAAIEAVLGVPVCKNLFLCNRQKTRYYLLMMPGYKIFHTKELSAQIESSRLSFGSPEAMEAMLGVRPGSVSVLGLHHDKEHRIQLLMDREILTAPMIGCHPCMNTSTLKIATKDILDQFLAFTGHTPREVVLSRK